jgi:hypothetical protein
MKSIIFILLLCFGFLNPLAKAAQVGTVIVDEASVVEYPQRGSRELSTVDRDAVLAVSNLPTEGFYKVRLASGDLGWISGNDIIVGKGANSHSRSKARKVPKGLPDENALDPLREESKDSRSKQEAKPKDGVADGFVGDDSRILLMFGAQYPSYGGFKQYYVTDGLTPGYAAILEFQFMLSKHWHWAARAELNFAKVEAKDVSTTTTQSLSQKSIPLLAGLNFSPFTSKSFRLGLGVYVGGALGTSLVVAQTTNNTTDQVTYESLDPTALAVVQMAFGLGSQISVVAEGGYRFQKTGTLSATTKFGGIPALQIDYSGPVGNLGFEFKF